jgi:translation initiation factor 2 subunit 1
MIKEEVWPHRGEVVIGNVVRVNPFSAFISLEEYPGKEGMIHISEVAGKWVRDIRKFVKVGDKVVVKVLTVDPAKGHIGLSLKRVRPYEADEKMKNFKKNIKSEKMLKILAEKIKLDANQISELEEKLGNIFDIFQMSQTPQGYDLMLRKGVSEDVVKAVKEVADQEMEIKETSVKKRLSLKSYRPDGINVIKGILAEAIKSYEVDIKYISAGNYSMAIETKNAKMGERKIIEASEFIIKKMQEVGGEGKVE